MSNADAAARPLRDRVLLHCAGRLGPALDVLDPEAMNLVEVREVVSAFLSTPPDSITPTDVRGALLELADAKLLGVGRGCDGEFDVVSRGASVGLTVRGLLAARAIEPECGKVPRIISLTSKARSHPLHVRVETGNDDLDHAINTSRVALAAVFVLLCKPWPRAKPLVIDEVEAYFERLALLKVGPKSGPGLRINPDAEAIRGAFSMLSAALPLKREWFSDDKRRDFWYLDGPLPEIRYLPGSRKHPQDWPLFRQAIFAVIHDQDFSYVGWNEVIRGESPEETRRKREERQRREAVAARALAAEHADPSLTPDAAADSTDS